MSQHITEEDNGSRVVAQDSFYSLNNNAIEDNDDNSSNIPWSSRSIKAKIILVSISVGKIIGIIVALYFFICSLHMLSTGFRLIGGHTTSKLFENNTYLSNPIFGVMIGVLATVLVQSSSTSTSIIVSVVGANVLTVRLAIPLVMVMGANIGTSMTNTIVSFGHIKDRGQFKLAFAGATVHDMFNWLTVFVLLILEVTTGYLYHLTVAITPHTFGGKGSNVELLGVITKPFLNLIVIIDNKVLECWVENTSENCPKSIIKNHKNCLVDQSPNNTECNFAFARVNWSDAGIGTLIIIIAVVTLYVCLVMMVAILKSVLKGKMAKLVKKTVNSNIPHVPWLTGYIAILVGAVMTFLLQSSSVFTSTLTPLTGLGIITVERAYPLTLGSNIGTTTTALLASLAVSGHQFYPSLQIALCHLFFNLSGIAIFYPIPYLRFPVKMAKYLGKMSAKYRWFAVAYVITMFILFPLIVMGLSFLGQDYVIVFFIILFIICLFITTINVLRRRRPNWLPKCLRTWEWLPLPLRSLKPIDDFLTRFECCQKLRHSEAHATEVEEIAAEEVYNITETESEVIAPEALVGITANNEISTISYPNIVKEIDDLPITVQNRSSVTDRNNLK